jgi:SAM-dependent methyltransferase
MKIINSLSNYDRIYLNVTSKIATWLVNFFRIDKNKTIVDVGCGFGALTIPLAKKIKKCKIIAIDKDPDSLEKLKIWAKKLEIKNITLIECDFKRIEEIENSSVDYVFSHWVISAILTKLELKLSFKEFHRILKPEGITAHLDGYPKNESEKLWKEVDEIGFVAKWWGIEEIKNIMRSIGFKDIRTKFFKFKFKVLLNVLIEDVKREKNSNLTGLMNYLNVKNLKIKNLGLEFPTEYVIYGKKVNL